MIKKTTLIEQIDCFPAVFTIDELIERLLLIEKIERGKKQSDNGEEVSEPELDKEIDKWFR